MKNLFEASSAVEIRMRIEDLRPESQRQWGAMNAAQMMSHCSAWFELAAGLTFSPRNFLGRIIGGMAKKSIMGEGRSVAICLPIRFLSETTTATSRKSNGF